MMLEKPLSIPKDVLDTLGCALCSGYLSCGPVRVLPDGSCICGRCSPLNIEAPIYRVLAFESILSKILFPCRFYQRGCAELVLFGQAIEHEAKCTFRSFVCAVNDCSWEGSSLELVTHFRKQHAEFVSKAEVKIRIGEGVQGILMTLSDGIGFLIKYLYDASKSTMVYDVRYCQNHVLTNVGYKLRLLNDSDPDCNVGLKMVNCDAFTESFYSSSNGSELNFNKFLSNLDSPSCIRIEFTVVISRTNDQGLVLESLRCEKCRNYLIPPLYDLDGWVVCCECAEHQPRSVPSNNFELTKLATETKFPCRWRDCTFLSSSAAFKSHEVTCTFRHYDCFFPSCTITFKLESAVQHLRNHRAVYLPDGLVYKTSYAQTYSVRHVFAVKANAIIVIQHSVVIDPDEVYMHRIALFSSESSMVSGGIGFEHPHCMLKSKLFAIFNKQNTDVALSELPPCFKSSDELSVTVNV